MTADLVAFLAFLNACLDEEESAAKAAADVAPGHWRAETYQNTRGTMSGELTTTGEIADDRLGWEGRLWGGYDDHPWTAAEVAVHVARHDPARVLADVQAKRAIIDHEDKWGEDDTILRLLAQPFADRPGFDPAWRVSATAVGEHQT